MQFIATSLPDFAQLPQEAKNVSVSADSGADTELQLFSELYDNALVTADTMLRSEVKNASLNETVALAPEVAATGTVEDILDDVVDSDLVSFLDKVRRFSEKEMDVINVPDSLKITSKIEHQAPVLPIVDPAVVPPPEANIDAAPTEQGNQVVSHADHVVFANKYSAGQPSLPPAEFPPAETASEVVTLPVDEQAPVLPPVEVASPTTHDDAVALPIASPNAADTETIRLSEFENIELDIVVANTQTENLSSSLPSAAFKSSDGMIEKRAQQESISLEASPPRISDTSSDRIETANMSDPPALASQIFSYLQSLQRDAETLKGVNKGGERRLADIIATSLENISMNEGAVSSHSLVESVTQSLRENGFSLLAESLAGLPIASIAGKEGANTFTLGDNLFSTTTSSEKLMVEQAQVKSEQVKHQPPSAGSEQALNILKAEGQQQLAEKIRWMVNGRQPQAEIRLDPPEMGSMQIRVNMSGDSASVSIIVQNTQARELLADALPKLRDMLAEQGLQLADSSVSQGQQGDKHAKQNFPGQLGAGIGLGGSEESMDEYVVEQTLSRQAQGGIDAYA